jgi:ABC-type transporter Mla subunit MlaD
MIGIGDLGDLIGGLAPVASQVLENLNQRLTEMRVTVAEVNDLLSDRNRTNISSGLGTLNSMLVETRPKVGASLDKVSVTLDNVQAATVKLDPVMTNVKMASDRLAPLLDGIQATMKQANDTLTHLDAVVVENRPDIQGAMVDIRKTLSTVSEAVEALRNTLDNNTGNLDDSLANVRASTENLKELTDTLKRKPSALIRGETGKDRKPGDKK